MTTKEKDNQGAWEDPIVAEVRKVREAFFAESGYNLYELSRRLRDKQALSGRVVVSRTSRPSGDTEAENTPEQTGDRS
jgi:hypothetical protein